MKEYFYRRDLWDDMHRETKVMEGIYNSHRDIHRLLLRKTGISMDVVDSMKVKNSVELLDDIKLEE